MNNAGLKQRKPSERTHDAKKATHMNFNRALKHLIKYYENLQKTLDARSTKKDKIQLRKNMLDQMKKFFIRVNLKEFGVNYIVN